MSKNIFCLLLIVALTPSFAQERETENIVIVTLDGLRWREVFNGADKRILFRNKYVKDTSVQEYFWSDNKWERRQKLMPFLWNVIGKGGQLYGNRYLKNKMRCTNGTYYSYAGYSEMFVGYHDRRVRNNEPKENPNFTVFEALNRHEDFYNSVAAFSTWQTMTHILREETSGIPVNSGADKAIGSHLTAKERRLNRLAEHHKNPNGDRYDRFTFQYAMEYMKRKKPRVTFISLDETDEQAHDGNYDEYLKAAHASDKMISDLWTWLQTDPQYRNKTTLIITTDHGRGKSPKGWKGHKQLFRGSSHIWMAVLGPDTPANGEMRNKMNLEQNQIASTIAEFLEFHYANKKPVGEPISTAFKVGADDDGIVTAEGE